MEHYQLLRKLGRGNFAKVYLALHLPSGKQVALKLIEKKDVSTFKMRQRIHREMQNMKKLKHSNIAEIYESKRKLSIKCDFFGSIVLMESVPKTHLLSLSLRE